MKQLCWLILVFSGLSLPAQPVDFTELSLFVTFFPERSEVSGAVYLKYAQTGKADSIWLDGIKMDYHTVQWNGAEVDFDYNEEGLWLKPDPSRAKKINEIFISYTAHPRKGLYFIGWDDETGLSKKQIWTQGQGIDHRHWIPHRDDQTDKVKINLNITFDKGYEVISNGVLKEKKEVEETYEWVYEMQKPMSSYLIAIAIGEYDSRQTQSKSGVPLQQYYYPERAEDYPWFYYKNEEIFNFLEEEIGVPYPWKNYKQVPVQDFRHGAMENTTATIFGDFFLVDSIAFNDRNYTYVNAHELAHQWFGNLVTAQNSDHHWLHEGFATYYQWLSEHNLYGQDYFDWERYKAAQLVFEASMMDTVPLGNVKAGSNRFYQKGAWVLYMLNHRLGRAKFREVMQYFLNRHSFGVVTTDSLNHAIKAVTGNGADDFFKMWVGTAGEPVMEMNSTLVEQEGQYALEITYLPQNFPPLHDQLKIPVKLVYANGREDIQHIYGESSAARLSLILSEEPVCWIVNPGMNLLARVKESKALEIWERQYELSTNVLDRYQAVLALGSFSIKDKRDLLRQIVRDTSEFFSLRAEALRQLLEADYDKYDQELMVALRSSDVQLQKEAVLLVNQMSGALRHRLQKLREGASYELRANAIHKSVIPSSPARNEWLYDSLYHRQPGIPGHEVLITSLAYRVLLFKDQEAFLHLVRLSSSGYDFITRISAMQALQSVGIFREDMLPHLFDALFDYNWKLRSQGRAMLLKYYKDKKYEKMIRTYIDEHRHEWDDFRIRTVDSTFGSNKN